MSHGQRGTPTYKSWVQMRHRCNAPSHHAWAAYGGRGILVCDRWSRFEHFLADMGVRPNGTQIDRINNDGNYEPSNCRWANTQQQARNRRSTVLLEHEGKTKCIAAWALELGVRPGLIGDRIRRGWPLSEAITTKPLPKELHRSRSSIGRSST